MRGLTHLLISVCFILASVSCSTSKIGSTSGNPDSYYTQPGKILIYNFDFIDGAKISVIMYECDTYNKIYVVYRLDGYIFEAVTIKDYPLFEWAFEELPQKADQIKNEAKVRPDELTLWSDPYYRYNCIENLSVVNTEDNRDIYIGNCRSVFDSEEDNERLAKLRKVLQYFAIKLLSTGMVFRK